MLRPPIERHTLKYVSYTEADRLRLPIPLKSDKALVLRYRTCMRGDLPKDLEKALVGESGKLHGVVPQYLEVFPFYPGLLDDPHNLIGLEAQYWMTWGTRYVYAPVTRETYGYLMAVAEEFRIKSKYYDRASFDVVVKPNWLFGVKKIDGRDWAYMRFKAETLPRQREEWYELDRYIHLFGDEKFSHLFPDWFFETCQPRLKEGLYDLGNKVNEANL